MCGVNNLTASLRFESVPRLPNLEYYIKRGCTTGGSVRNWKSYGHKVSLKGGLERAVLTDPQTNGGLLIAVEPSEQTNFETLMRELDPDNPTRLIGSFERRPAGSEQVVTVQG
jgi:selenide, water dikinase